MTKSYGTMIQNASPNFSNTNFKTFIWCHGESRVWMLSFQPSKLAVTRLGTRRVVNLLGNEPVGSGASLRTGSAFYDLLGHYARP
jgi:hypothetical protein